MCDKYVLIIRSEAPGGAQSKDLQYVRGANKRDRALICLIEVVANNLSSRSNLVI